ncbi:MAG TPA: ACP S-malonyltransferase [Acidimicrobiia bacterium]|nr:ACP S-malonyltransferase [Acidimicrobiia bacterium]
MAYAVLFPGQGSQFVGMGADVFQARPDLVGDRADSFAGFSLRRLSLEGSEEELTRTEHAQPALFALSYALWDEFSRKAPAPSAAAGHSLGEYTALAAAGVFSYDVAMRIVAARGRAMAAAADAEPSAMAAVIGSDLDAVEAVCAARRAEGGKLWVANINAPGQVVVAGGVDDVTWLGDAASDLGLRRVMELAVAGAFHSPYMEPAADHLKAVLQGVDPAPPRFPVYSNVSAESVRGAEVIEALTAQVVSPVRFSDCLEAMAEAGIDTFVHVGPGDVTAGLVKRTVKDATVLTVSDLSGVADAAEALSSMG